MRLQVRLSERLRTGGLILAFAAMTLAVPKAGLAQDGDGTSGESEFTAAVFQASCQTIQNFLSDGDLLYTCDATRDQCDLIRGGALGFCSGTNGQTIRPALGDPLERNKPLTSLLFGSIIGTGPVSVGGGLPDVFTNTICHLFGTPGTAPRTGPPSGRVLPPSGVKICRQVAPGTSRDCPGDDCPATLGGQDYIEVKYDATACSAIRQILQSTVTPNPNPAFALFTASKRAGMKRESTGQKRASEILFVCDLTNGTQMQATAVDPATFNLDDALAYTLPNTVVNTPGCSYYRGTMYCR